MADVVDYTDLVLEKLRTLRTLTIYDGDVDDNPPDDRQGRVYPYAVMWPSPGTPALETITAQAGEPITLDWDFQITCVGGTRRWCQQSVVLVRSVLTNLNLGDGAGILREQVNKDLPILKDKDVTPIRYFYPLRYKALI
ncbi:MAG: hypothetical protein WAS05_00220 [Candidatus Nanopelagicales bacterium]